MLAAGGACCSRAGLWAAVLPGIVLWVRLRSPGGGSRKPAALLAVLCLRERRSLLIAVAANGSSRLAVGQLGCLQGACSSGVGLPAGRWPSCCCTKGLSLVECLRSMMAPRAAVLDSEGSLER